MEYMRDYGVRCARGVKEHLTGRFCDNAKCRGPLTDTIINFGESLPERDLTLALDQGLAFVHTRARASTLKHSPTTTPVHRSRAC